jgi:serine/threonine protein kinase
MHATWTQRFAVHDGRPGFFVSSSATDFLQMLLAKSPADRITIPEMREHPWIDSHGFAKLVSINENTVARMDITPTQEEVDTSLTAVMPPRASVRTQMLINFLLSTH